MNLVLAVEPDVKHVEILQRIIRQQGDSKLVVVSTSRDAAETMNQQVPDLVLLGTTLDKESREHVVDHFILASDAPEPQTLPIPALYDAEAETPTGRSRKRKSRGPAPDLDAFSAEVASCLACVERGRLTAKSQPVSAVIAPGPDPLPATEPEDAEVLIDVEPSAADLGGIDPEVHAAQLERVRAEAAKQHAEEIARMRAAADARLLAEVSEARAAAAAEAATTLTAELERARRAAEQTLASELAREQAGAARRLAEQIAEADAQRAAAVEKAALAAEKSARLALDSEIGRITSDADTLLAARMQQVREEAEAAAARTLETEVARVRAEADARREAELALARQEADRQRAAAVEKAALAAEKSARLALDSEIGRITSDADTLLAARMQQVREEAEAAAARTLETEVARVQAEADARREAELALARQEADRQRAAAVEKAALAAEKSARLALDSEIGRITSDADTLLAARMQQVREEAEAAAARTLETEVARVQAEADARREAELALARQEADKSLRLQHQAHLDTATARDAEVRQARAAAEAAAAHAHDTELTRIRSEADRHAQQQLERVRAEADDRLRQETGRLRAEIAQAREAHRTAQAGAEAARAAAHEARAAVEAAVEAAAGRAHQAEVTRAEAENRLRGEVEQLRQEIERGRISHLSALEQVRADARREMQTAHQTALELARADAEREALALAEEMVQAATARAQADFDTRLAAEVATLAESERRRVAGLAAIRAQLDQLSGEARDQAATALIEVAPVAPTTLVAQVPADVVDDVAANDELPEEEEEGGGSRGSKIAAMHAAAQVAGRVAVQVAGFALAAVVWVSRLAFVSLGKAVRTGLPIARDLFGQLPARTVPAMLVLLLIVVGVKYFDISPLALKGTSAARSASRTAASAIGTAVHAVPAAFDGANRTSPPSSATVGTAGAPRAAAAPTVSGLLNVFSRVPLELHLSGRRIGSTDDRQIVLTPGRHQIALVSTRLNYRGEAIVDIRSGELTTHNVALPDGLLRLDTEPGAEVSIEGQLVGVAPLDALPMPLGTREVLVRHPQLGERRAHVEVKYGGVTEVQIPLRDAAPAVDAPTLP